MKGGSASINVKSGRDTLTVENTETMVSVSVDSGENGNWDESSQTPAPIGCYFWDGEGPSTEGCSPVSIIDGKMTCRCTHLTDFMGMLSSQVIDTFKEGN